MDQYECPCGYVYDPEVGDPDNNIPAGTPFDALNIHPALLPLG